MATKKATKKKTKKKASRKKKAGTAGLVANKVVLEERPEHVDTLAGQVEADGGQVIGAFRDPLGGHWQLLVSLPTDQIEPTTFQRDLSDTHVKKLAGVIERLQRFLDPILIVRMGEKKYATPNGHHRLEAMRRLGGRSLTALLIPEIELAYQILALNTEKAPNLKDRSLEVIRLARALVEIGDPEEATFELEFEEPSLLTIGACYEKRARFSGSTYHPILKKIEAYFELPLSESITEREARAERMLEVDDEVARLVKELKAAGFDSPYLKAFVVARINPVRGPKASGDFDEVMDKLIEKAQSFDVSKVDASQIGRSG